jgi:hypothetical protein
LPNDFSGDHGYVEKLVRIAAMEGAEVILEHLDGTLEEDQEAHRATTFSKRNRRLAHTEYLQIPNDDRLK